MQVANNQWINKIDVDSEDWRFLFKDQQSKQLSDEAERSGKISFTIWIRIPSVLQTSQMHRGFELEIEDPQLCDGGFISHFISYDYHINFFSKLLTLLVLNLMKIIILIK